MLFSQVSALIHQRFDANLRKIIGNTIWLFADRVVQMVMSLFVGILVTRYLGPEQFGVLNYAIAFMSLFGVVSNLGMDDIIVRDLVRHPAQANQILGTAFILRVITSILTAVIAIGSIFMIREDAISRSIVAILTLTSLFNALPIDRWFQAQVDSKHVIWAKNLGYFTVCIVRVVLVHYQAPLVAFAWAALAEVALGAVGQIVFYQLKHHAMQLWRFKLEWAKSLLKESWPLMISGMVIIIYMRIDQIMLGQMMNDRAVGTYAAGVKISEMFFFIPGTIISSVSPSIIQAREQPQLYHARLQKLFNLMAFMGYGLAIPVTLMASGLVAMLYGQEFTSASAVLALHIWAGLFVFIGMARVPFLISEGLTRFSAMTSALGGAINIVLNYFLIPSYGAVGAVAATIIAQMFASYLCHAFHPKARILFRQQTRALFLLDYFQLKF